MTLRLVNPGIANPGVVFATKSSGCYQFFYNTSGAIRLNGIGAVWSLLGGSGRLGVLDGATLVAPGRRRLAG